MPQLLKTSTAAADPVQLSAAAKNFRHATMIACNSLNGPSAGPNTGRVQIGLSAATDEQPIEFNPGDERTFTAPAGGMLDLSQYYLKVANNGDGLVIVYQ
jgi:hypothetical protein